MGGALGFTPDDLDRFSTSGRAMHLQDRPWRYRATRLRTVVGRQRLCRTAITIDTTDSIVHMRRMQIQVPDEIATAMEQYAKETGQSVAAAFRDAAERLLADGERARRWDRALAGVGGFHSGLRDVSENHDEYFAQAIEERIGRR